MMDDIWDPDQQEHWGSSFKMNGFTSVIEHPDCLLSLRFKRQNLEKTQETRQQLWSTFL